VRRRLAAALALVLAALLCAGCAATLEVEADIDRDGRGSVTLRLTMDTEAQEALGLAADADPAEAAARFAPLLGDGGWASGDAQIAATRDEDTGELVLETTRLVDSTDQLDEILSFGRPIAQIAPDASTLSALPGLPPEAPLLNAVDLRLGDGSGDNPGFDLFARGGVGEIGGDTCAGDDVVGFARSLRDALEIRYALKLPGGPGSTNADETPRGENVWLARYGDCPPLQASSGGGSSSTLVNGVILAGLTGLLLVIFALRAIRRRRPSEPS
jgi:hypothetical protein